MKFRTPKPRGNVLNYFSGSSNKTYETSDVWIGVHLLNDGGSDIIVKVNGLEITVKAGEKLDDDFEEFTRIEILSTVTYRLFLRG